MDTKLIETFTRSILALVVVVGGLLLMARGIDTIIGGLLVAVVGFYFGAEFLRRQRK